MDSKLLAQLLRRPQPFDLEATNAALQRQALADNAPAGSVGAPGGINFSQRTAAPMELKDVMGALSFAPGIGDAAGLMGDAAMYATKPETRTPGNYALSAMGLLPLVPAATVSHEAFRPLVEYAEKMREKASKAWANVTNAATVTERREARTRWQLADKLKRHANEAVDSLNAPSNQIPTPSWAPENAAPSLPAAGEDWWKANLPSNTEQLVAEIAKTPRMFSYASPPAGITSVDQIAAHYSAESGIPLRAELTGRNIKIHTPNGSLDIVGAQGQNPYISSMALNSRGQARGGGREAYQTAYSWLAANGKKASVDPAGITQINELRKASNVLAGELRAGKPVADVNFLNLPRSASPAQIIAAEADEAARRVPELNRITVNEDGFLLDGSPLSPAQVGNFLTQLGAVNAGVGPMTAMRHALVRYAQNGGDVKTLLKKLPGPILPGIAAVSLSNTDPGTTSEN